jgi:hypothetical protein
MKLIAYKALLIGTLLIFKAKPLYYKYKGKHL